MPGSFPVAAVVCLMLMALLAVVQVAHFHADQSDSSGCPLCVAMHTVAPATGMAAVVVMVLLGTAAPIAELRALVRFWNPQLFTRPPPASC
jgi:hypothetical protein